MHHSPECFCRPVLLPESLPGRLLLRPWDGSNVSRVCNLVLPDRVSHLQAFLQTLAIVRHRPHLRDMDDAFFFGYGSLVNRHTHDYPDALPVTIRGWRREWRMARSLGRTFLSVVPDAGAQIDGLVARVPGNDWAALDLRETGYQRHALGAGAFARGPSRPAMIYAIAAQDADKASHTAPIKLSYLDVVVEGFDREFGAEGVARFFDTTRGWGPVLDDRAAPLYPRARPVAAHLQRLVDDRLHNLGVLRLGH